MKTFNKFLILLLFVSALSVNVFADRELPKLDSLSESSYIALLTCDPGPDLYSVFGHTAIGVVDPEQGLNLIFNYGTFSFEVPFFYAKFASGKLLYKLSITSYRTFLHEYEYQQRKVVEEKLNLTKEQRQKLFDLLIENYKPENREYQYDFFFDNCATRIIDIFHESLGESLVYVPTENAPQRTFRNMLDEYLTKNYWSDFGIDLALGSVIDKPANDKEKTFLPDYLSKYVNSCTIDGERFVVSRNKLVKESAVFPSTPWLIRPQVVFWFLFIVVVLLTLLFRSKNWIIGDRIIFGVFGLLGLVIFLMWVATDHDATKGNLNVLWTNPLYLVFIWLIGSRHRQTLKWTATAIFAINVLVLVGWNIIPQMYHVAFIPIIGILIVRSGVMAWRIWKG